MKKILIYFSKVLENTVSKIKIFIFKLLNFHKVVMSKANFPFDFCKKIVEKDGNIELGNNFHARKWCYIRVRSGGVLRVGRNVSLNNRVSIVCREKINIGDNTIIGENVAIYDHNHIYNGVDVTAQTGFITKKVLIGNNVWIGSNVTILPGAEIGDNCVIGAGTVVTHIIPNNSVVYDYRNQVVKAINAK